MSDDFRLRRRLTPTGPRRARGGNNWLITIVAAIVVIAVGWFAGTTLARYSNNRANRKVAQIVTAAPATPQPSPAQTATPSSSPSPKATANASASPKPSAKPTAQPTATAAPSQKPKPSPALTTRPRAVATVAPTPVRTQPPRRHTEPVARRPEVVAPAADQSAAETIVRNYIDAMRRGSPDAASVYLANGSPDESFIGSGTTITSLSATRNSDSSFSVVVKMQAPQGRYQETFIVSATPEGERILNKSVSQI